MKDFFLFGISAAPMGENALLNIIQQAKKHKITFL